MLNYEVCACATKLTHVFRGSEEKRGEAFDGQVSFVVFLLHLLRKVRKKEAWNFDKFDCCSSEK